MRDRNAPNVYTDAAFRRRIQKACRHLDNLMPLFEQDSVDDGWLGRVESAAGAAEDEASNTPLRHSSEARGIKAR